MGKNPKDDFPDGADLGPQDETDLDSVMSEKTTHDARIKKPVQGDTVKIAREPKTVGDWEFLQSLGKYEVIEKIGQGGMGKVFKVRHRVIERTEALKLLPLYELDEDQIQGYMARFRKEVQTLSQLKERDRNLAIPQVYDFECRDGFFYYTMEYVAGKSLLEMIEKKLVTVDKAVLIALEIAEVLEVIHAQGIIHRDLKPGNIILDSSERAWLVDFGLVKDLESEATRITQAGGVGTPRYMAPEQIEGVDIGPPVDIYALGAVLYEMLTLQPAVAGKSREEFYYQIFNVMPTLPSKLVKGVDATLDHICRRALQKKARDRYPDVASFKEDLRRCVPGGGPAISRPAARPARRKMWVSLGVLLVLAGIFLYCREFFRSSPAPRVPPVTDRQERHEQSGDNAGPSTRGDENRRPPTSDNHGLPAPVSLQIVVLDPESYEWAEAKSLAAGDFYKIRIKVDRESYVYGFEADKSRNIQECFPARPSRYRFDNPVLPGTYEIPPEDGVFKVTAPGTVSGFYFVYGDSPLENPGPIIENHMNGKVYPRLIERKLE